MSKGHCMKIYKKRLSLDIYHNMRNIDLNKLETHKTQDNGDYLCVRTCSSSLCTDFAKPQNFVSHR